MVARLQSASAGAHHSTFPNPITPGSLIVVQGGAGTGVTMTPDARLTEAAASPYNCSGFNQKVALWWAVSRAGDGQSWGFTPSGGEATSIIAEYSGLWGASPIVTSGPNCEGHVGPVHTSVALTPGNGRSIVVVAAMCHNAGSADVCTIDAPLNKLVQINAPTTNLVEWYGDLIVPASAGSYAPGGTDPNGLNYAVEVIGAIFAEAGRPAFIGEPGGGLW